MFIDLNGMKDVTYDDTIYMWSYLSRFYLFTQLFIYLW
jgi:hypothetical protein